MTKAVKRHEGDYRTEDGQWQILKYGDVFLVNQLQGRRWVPVETAKTLAAAEKALSTLTKSEEEVVEPSPAAVELVAPPEPVVEETKDEE